MRMRSKQLARLIFMVVLFLSTGIGAGAQATRRIGVIGAADGSLVKGARLAAERINAGGGLRNASGFAYQLRVVDTPADNMDIAVANMRQARAIAVLGPDSADLVRRNMPLLAGLNMPIFTAATDDDLLWRDESRRIFRSRASQSDMADALADYVVYSLGARAVSFIQLDTSLAGSIAALSEALAAQGLRLSSAFVDARRSDLGATARSLRSESPRAVVIAGAPGQAGLVVNELRAEGYAGAIVYDRADDAAFLGALAGGSQADIIAAQSWSVAQQNPMNREFVLAYVQRYRQVPDAFSVAAYDAVTLLARAFAMPGDLTRNLAALREEEGAQGLLTPALLRRGETSRNVVITRLDEDGRQTVAAQYRDGQQTSAFQLVTAASATTAPIRTPTPFATPTPAGYHLVVQSRYQNVRSGPGLEYDVIGQAIQGAQLRVLGRSPDNNWLVIDYRGQYGWLAAYLVETFGAQNLIPIIQPPMTPTPIATSTPPAPSLADIIVVAVGPKRLPLNQPTSVDVTVMNRSASPAGYFSIAATFQPGSYYSSASVNGLSAGESKTVQLTAQISGAPGQNAVVIVADLNQQVWEGEAGEANNDSFIFHYIADRAVYYESSTTLSASAVDLEGFGGIPDIGWQNGIFRTLNNAALVQISEYDRYQDISYGDIDAARAYGQTLSGDQALYKTFGIVTSEGRRGVVYFYERSPEGWLRLRYRIYH